MLWNDQHEFFNNGRSLTMDNVILVLGEQKLRELSNEMTRSKTQLGQKLECPLNPFTGVQKFSCQIGLRDGEVLKGGGLGAVAMSGEVAGEAPVPSNSVLE